MPKGKSKKVTQRLEAVEEMMLNHFTEVMIIRAAASAWGLKPRSVRDYIAQVRDRWTKENEDNRHHKKAAAVNRLMRLARNLKDAPGEVLKVEKLLSDIEGTKAPIQVEQDTTLEIESQSHEALSALAQALGVSVDEIAKKSGKS